LKKHFTKVWLLQEEKFHARIILFTVADKHKKKQLIWQQDFQSWIQNLGNKGTAKFFEEKGILAKWIQ
jgi:hypothetical protein